jgi:hypothetical protein
MSPHMENEWRGMKDWLRRPHDRPFFLMAPPGKPTMASISRTSPEAANILVLGHTP